MSCDRLVPGLGSGAAVRVAATVGDHLVREGLPLISRHEVLHLESQAEDAGRALHPLNICLVDDFGKLRCLRLIAGVQGVELSVVGPLSFTAFLEFLDDFAGEHIHLLRLLGVLDGPIDQPLHILLPLLPVGVALAPAHHAVVMVMR